MSTFSRLSKTFGRSISRNSPAILTGLGISGFLTAIGMAIEATPRALDKIASEEMGHEPPDYNNADIIDVVPLRRKIELTWKLYIPTVSIATISTVSILLSHKIHIRRNTALIALQSASEFTLREYQKRVIEELGEKKEALLRGDVAEKELDSYSLGDAILTEQGDHLCFDSMSGRYFRSDIEKIRRVQNNINEKLISEMFVTLNDLYYELDLPMIDIGSEVGWALEKGQVDIDFDSVIAPNGEPCIVIGLKKNLEYLWF